MLDEEADDRNELCELCAELLEESGDNWDGLCPCCADLVSEYMDATGLNDEQRNTAIRVLAAIRERHP